MKSSRSAVAISIAIILMTLSACQRAENQAAPPSRVPITTSSEAALEAYLEGRDLQERLLVVDAREKFKEAVALDPDLGLAHLGLANTAPGNLEFFQAVKRADEVTGNVSEGERLMIEAFMAGVNGQPAAQVAALKELETAFPDDERVQQQLGVYQFFTTQDYPQAAAHFRRAAQINPDFSPAYNLLGYSQRFIGDYDAAEDAFLRYIELIPDNPNPLDSYAELLLKTGRYDESIDSYREALAVDPSFVNSYVGIAANLIFQGDAVEARAVIDEMTDAARTDGQRRQACTWGAVSYLNQGDFDGALSEIDRRAEIARQKDDFGALANDLNFTGDILLVAGRTDEAEEAFRECVQTSNRSDATDDAKAAVHRNEIYDLARVTLARNGLEEAESLAGQYREQVNAHQIPFELRRSHALDGMVAFEQGDYGRAIAELEQANQQNPRVLFALAKALRANGDTEAAVAMLEQVAHFNQLNVNHAFVRVPALEMLGG